MSEFSLILVLRKKQENPTIDMVKIQIKSERLTPFEGLFSIMEQFDSTLSSVIDLTLGLRCRSFGYGIAGKDGARDIRCVDGLFGGGVGIVASSKKYVVAIVGLIADYRQCLTRQAVKSSKELNSAGTQSTLSPMRLACMAVYGPMQAMATSLRIQQASVPYTSFNPSLNAITSLPLVKATQSMRLSMMRS